MNHIMPMDTVKDNTDLYYFFDIHCHAMNLSHPNLVAFINRLPLLALAAMPLLGPFISFLGVTKMNRIVNLLSVMENDIADFFLIMEFYLRKEGYIKNEKFLLNDIKYDGIILTPLLMDFGYKNIKSSVYYNVPPQKPIVEQTLDVFNGITKYCNYELVEPQPGKYRVKNRKGRAIFEIYPFLGINTINYESEEVSEIIEKYFKEYTGSHEALKANLGKFEGDIEKLGSNFFSGIKVYPPMAFDPWPESNNKELEKVKLLYKYCCKKNIPITAHCSNVGFVLDEKDALTYSSPARWKKVLEYYPDLKLNLAHFGNMTYFLGLFKSSDWQIQIIDLINKHRNVYTDFSCCGFNDDYYRSLKKIICNNNYLLDHILFGTDFMINLLWIDSYNEYLNIFGTTKHLSPGEKKVFCSTNPSRFLFGKD